MDELGLWAILAFALFALVAAAAAGAQAALHFVSRVRLRLLLQDGSSQVQAVQRAVEEPTTILVTTVLVYTTAVVGAAAAGVIVVLQQWAAAPWIGSVTAVALLFVLLALQLLARAIAMYRPGRAAAVLVRPMRLLSRLFWPVVAPATAIERSMLRAFGVQPPPEPNGADQELRALVEAVAEENGRFDGEEREMIENIFDLSQRPVREIMVPRIDVVALDRESTVRDVLDKIAATGHSRIPIYDGSVDNVVGIVFAKDLLRHLRTDSQDSPVEALARAAHFVPETKKIDELLREMQVTRSHMAVVVDEYGGTAGLITIEDVLEEIVGEIQDEYDTEEEALFERLGEHEAIFDARINLRDVGEVLDVDLQGELEEHEYDTLGGLVYERLGKVPMQGDQIRVNGCLISVLSTEGHRIKKLHVLVDALPAEAREKS